MNKTRLMFFASCLFVALLVGPVLGQQPQQQAHSLPTGIALQVMYYKGAPLGYQSVPGPETDLRGAWYARFGRISAWQAPAGALPVQAVNILSCLEGDAVRISVSVFTGVHHHDKEEPVASYLARVNDKLLLSELAQFGVEPFEITVLRVTPAPPAPPLVVNQTQSVAVVSILSNSSATLPSYKLSLRNLSDKNISALFIQSLSGNVERINTMPHHNEGQTLIKAGDIYEMNFPGITKERLVPDNQGPEPVPSQQIVIRSVMFEDKSYEGDVKYAAEFRSFMMGDKIQLAKLAKIFRDAYKENDEDTPAALEKLRAQVSALGVDINETAIDELARDFPELGPNAKSLIKSWIEVSLHSLRRETLALIDAYEKSREQKLETRDLRAWLALNLERYESWRSRLY